METVPKRKLKWWQWGIIGFVGISLAKSIILPSPTAVGGPLKDTSSYRDANAKFTKIAPLTFAMVFDAHANPNDLTELARDKCKTMEICTVLGWSDPKKSAGAMPMTDREVADQLFQYDLNRNSGLDRALVNCTFWPSHKDCLGQLEPADPKG